jgi:hypothetical protein
MGFTRRAVCLLWLVGISCQGAGNAPPGSGPPSSGDDGDGGSGGSGGAVGSGGPGGSGGTGMPAPERDASAPPADAPPGRDAPATGGAGGAPATPRDAGAAAADVVTVPISAQCKDVMFCDDFENQTLGALPGGIWKTTTNTAKIVVDGSKSFSGGKSVMITVEPTGSSARGLLRLTKPQLPLATNNMFGRMMFWVNAIPTQRVHWFNVWATGKLPSGQTADYAIGGLGTTYILNYFPGDCWKNSVTFPTGRWACLQWQFDGSKNPDGTLKDEMRAWLDGKSIGTVVKTGSGCIMAPAKSEWVAPPFEELRLGWERAGGNQIQMWLDDVAVDTKPIPCPVKP